MKVRVEIKWDKPEEQHWLCPDNIKHALELCCKNTKFGVTEIAEPAEAQGEGDITIWSILEDLKLDLHGSEYDYHAKTHSVEQHNEYMRKALECAEERIKALITAREQKLKAQVRQDLETIDYCDGETTINKLIQKYQ
jgi:hypothetical protein